MVKTGFEGFCVFTLPPVIEGLLTSRTIRNVIYLFLNVGNRSKLKLPKGSKGHKLLFFTLGRFRIVESPHILNDHWFFIETETRTIGKLPRVIKTENFHEGALRQTLTRVSPFSTDLSDRRDLCPLRGSLLVYPWSFVYIVFDN